MMCSRLLVKETKLNGHGWKAFDYSPDLIVQPVIVGVGVPTVTGLLDQGKLGSMKTTGISICQKQQSNSYSNNTLAPSISHPPHPTPWAGTNFFLIGLGTRWLILSMCWYKAWNLWNEADYIPPAPFSCKDEKQSHPRQRKFELRT